MKLKVMKIVALLCVGILIFFISSRFFCSPSRLAPKINSVRNISIEDINAQQIILSLIVDAENKNNFDLNIKDLDIIIINNRDTLGKAFKEELVALSANSVNAIRLQVYLNTLQTAGIFQKPVDTLELNLVGNLTADFGIVAIPVDINIPFPFSLKQNIYETIEKESQKDKIITIKQAKISEIGLSNSVVLISFLLRNPYNIDFKLIGYPSQIFINGMYAGDGDIADSLILIQKEDISSGEFLFVSDNVASVTSLFGSLFTGKFEYETRGILNIEILDYIIELPYNFKGVLIKL